MIWARRVSSPTFTALISNTVFPLIVPPVIISSFDLSTGIGSPVIILSSMTALPSFITPSTGIFSPGLTRRISPALTCSRGISTSFPLVTSLATGGTRFNKALMAELVFPCAFNSRTWPIRTRVIMTAEASKYKWTFPCMSLNCEGKIEGNRRAKTLNRYADPTPIEINVHILGAHLRTELHPRLKKTHPE